MAGTLSILNVGAGDVRLHFNTRDTAETIRAKRIVTDMLRRGYALLVEVERNGERAYERVREFDEATGEYIIADFDPESTHTPEIEVKRREQAPQAEAETPGDLPFEPANDPPEPTVKRGRGRPRRLPAATTNAVAVGRSAGG